jgi:hypothetical protein
MTRRGLAGAVGALALLTGTLEVADGLRHVQQLTFLLRAEPVVGMASVLGGWGLILLLPWSRRLLLAVAPVQVALATWNGLAVHTVGEARVPIAVFMVVFQLAVVIVLRHGFGDGLRNPGCGPIQADHVSTQ